MNEILASERSAPRNPAGHSPRRRPVSVRRTSSIDMTWPDGRDGLLSLQGHARDVFTAATGAAPAVLAEDRLAARLGWDRVIREIACEPMRENIGAFVRARGGGHLRRLLDDLLQDERALGTPLNLLLDDISGASLIAGWAWSRWTDDWMRRAAASARQSARHAPRSMENVCAGFRTGSSALRPDGGSSPAQSSSPVVPLPHPEDSDGWHPLTEHTEVAMRRARRMDIWLDEVIRIDASFQDSASAPEGGRVAIHEYTLHLTADPASRRLLSVTATPHILPYPECPAAADNVARLRDAPLSELRTLVIQELPGTLGCTHLNDALRALADVPGLLERLAAETFGPK